MKNVAMKILLSRVKLLMNSATDLSVDAAQVGVATFGFTWTVWCYVMMSHSGRGNTRGSTLYHTRAHVGSCRRADTASQAAQI